MSSQLYDLLSGHERVNTDLESAYVMMHKLRDDHTSRPVLLGAGAAHIAVPHDMAVDLTQKAINELITRRRMLENRIARAERAASEDGET